MSTAAAAKTTAGAGQARLAARLRAWAARDRVAALEEALLGGTFWRFALRRLSVFAFARGWATALHVVELTFLSEIFAARPFVASLALQNATFVADAFWWGALEGLRRRLRAAGIRADAQRATTRYMTVAFAAGLVGCLVPLARMGWRWRAGTAPTMLDAYAFVCLLRLAIDMVLRAFYSGVYAYGRVHRPAWSAAVAPTITVAATVALWRWLGGWSFVAALLASVIVSRALLLAFTLRGYRLARVPLPRWRWPGRRRAPADARRSRARPRAIDWRLVGQSALAGTANLTTRLASVALLVAVVPSLRSDSGEVQLLAYVLHLAAPMVLVTSQWAFIFYHDWKRLEPDVAAVLARRLNRGLVAVAAVLAAVAWIVTAGLVVAFVVWAWGAPVAPVMPVLVALAPTYLGLAIWTALQLRGFSRGEFVAQALSAAVVVGAVAVAAVASLAPGDPRVWYWTLAGCPWLAVGAHALLARWLPASRWRSADTLDGWIALLQARRDPLVVWRGRLAPEARSGPLAEQIRQQLAARDAATGWRQWLFCFEGAPGAGRAGWLTRCAGLLAGFDACPTSGGAAGAAELVSRGWLRPPDPGLDAKALEREHARLFPGGLVLRVGRRPPAAFAALAADVRQAIWRDAIRRVTGGRRRASPASEAWHVSAFAAAGRLSHVFLAPRAAGTLADPSRARCHRSWALLLQQAVWRVPAPDEEQRFEQLRPVREREVQGAGEGVIPGPRGILPS
ncbi:MAG TPA: hypothetical protein VIF57_17640 [Polyangia bacterium]